MKKADRDKVVAQVSAMPLKSRSRIRLMRRWRITPAEINPGILKPVPDEKTEVIELTSDNTPSDDLTITQEPSEVVEATQKKVSKKKTSKKTTPRKQSDR